MFFVIRGTDSRTNEDFEMVVEATCGAGAEMWAIKRNIPYVIIAEANGDEIARAREAKRLWRYTPEPKYKVFGRPVMAKQMAALLLCGVWTIAVLLVRTNSLPNVLSRTSLSKASHPASYAPNKARSYSAAPHADFA